MAAASSSASTRPSPSTPTIVTPPSAPAANTSLDSRTAECSTAASTTCEPRSTAPQVAAAMASVAPLVNTTSRLRAPNCAATCSRACSSIARLVIPSTWMRLGSATSARLDSSSHATMASRASGRSGEVEA